MSSRASHVRSDGPLRRRRQLIIKERNISADEFMAASIGDLEWLDQSLKESGNHSSLDKNGLAPIHLAALHGRLNCLQLLIEKYDVDVNLLSATGWSPLHLCINKDTGSRAFKCMNYLLRQGAVVNCFNDDNVTPAHQAASEGLLECLKVLIENEADLNVVDVRGHLPLDLAKLWAHKSCFKLIKTEMWKRNKQERMEEMKQLNTVKQRFGNLQKEALYQLKNEQEFYGGIAFGNWLSGKGLVEDFKNASTLQRERYPEVSTDSLSRRLRTGGGLADCAQRMEKTNAKQQKRQIVQKEQTSMEKPSSKRPTKAMTNQSKAGKPKVSEDLEPKPIKRVVKVERPTQERKPVSYMPQREFWESTKTYTPFSEITAPSEKPIWTTRWNYSTNVNSEPVTDIKRKDTVAISIHPDEYDMVLPNHANLPVKLEAFGKPKIKITLPGGRIRSADIRMPHLPSSIIYEMLSGLYSDRIRIPQEFKAIHVYDIQRKKQPDIRHIEEIGMHLSATGDTRLLRKSSSTSSDSTLLPPIQSNTFNRILDSLHRMDPPETFLV